jgi:hypothetical protein
MALGTHIVRRAARRAWRVEADVCVLGAGIAGISAALEAARLGLRVALVDGQPTLGGQSVNALIGTFCGLFSNGPTPYQVTHGIADEILRDLGQEGALHHLTGRRNTTIVQYDEVALARWIERSVAAERNVTPVLGAMLREVERDGRRLRALALATRHGDVAVAAAGFVDASGDATLTYEAGFDCREPNAPIFGTQMITLEGVNEAAKLNRDEVEARLKAKGREYGLTRLDGFVFAIPGTGRALVNMTHLETPLDPLGHSRQQIAGRAEADRLVHFLKTEFPEALGAARVRSYGQLGVRQTRWIAGGHHMTADEVRRGERYPDAILRCSWPIELHDRAEGAHWEVFGDDHMHYAPLRSLVPREADNLVAVGRCIDGDPAALSSVRVMGPCIAMGAAAAHALDLAGAGSLHQVEVAALQRRLSDNLERTD